MNIKELIVCLRIEEDNRRFEKRSFTQTTIKANVIKHGENSKQKKPKSSKVGLREGINKIFSRRFFNYDRVGHKSSKWKKPKANLNDRLEMDLCTVVSKVNLVGSNLRQWWIYTDATKHVSCNNELLYNFEEVKDEERLFMGNSVIQRRQESTWQEED